MSGQIAGVCIVNPCCFPDFFLLSGKGRVSKCRYIQHGSTLKVTHRHANKVLTCICCGILLAKVNGSCEFVLDRMMARDASGQN